MILKGSQRSGATQLAIHLMNERDNDHVTLEELRGFVAEDLHGALNEAHAISKGTRCKQFMFSLSLNPPKEAAVGLDTLMDAVDRAEEALGLDGQPRAVILHEKEGRRHAHVVWSRIDAEEMKAINLPHFKNRLNALAKELYLEHGWALPDGFKENGWKNPLNFTLAEWQQAKRLDLDPREIRQVFQEAWQRSDNQASFRHALEEHGYYLAKGDRRGFVALDIHGGVYAVSRLVGVKTQDVQAKLGDPSGLPSVDESRADLRKRVTKQLRGFINESRADQAAELAPLREERDRMVAAHRAERAILIRKQEERRRAETKQRSERLHKGLLGVWELLTGKAAAIRRENDRDAFKAYLRDRGQRETLYEAQAKERAALQLNFETMRRQHRTERKWLTRRAIVLRKVIRLARNRLDRERHLR